MPQHLPLKLFHGDEDSPIGTHLFHGSCTDLSFVVDLTVSGSGTTGGTLHVEGTWQAPGPVGDFKINGTLGDRQVAVLVPQA